MHAIVTGGCGFIGGHLVDQLLSDGYKVTVIDNESAEANEEFYKNSKAIYHKISINDYELIEPLFKDVDYVFHLAAESRIGPCIENPSMACQTNIMGTCNILQASRLNNVKRVVYSSTSACYGLTEVVPMHENLPMDNLNPYSTSKLGGEDLCNMYTKLYGLETVSLRYFNVFGERMPETGQYAPVIAIFQRQIREGQDMTIVGDGLQKRDFVYVKDVVDANMRASLCDSNFCGTAYNVGTGGNISVLDIAKLLKKPYVHIAPRDGEARNTRASIDKIKKIGWVPTVSVEEWLLA
jgi:UDP-glucose 4-epimerase